jgi:hypothetical protein
VPSPAHASHTGSTSLHSTASGSTDSTARPSVTDEKRESRPDAPRRPKSSRSQSPPTADANVGTRRLSPRGHAAGSSARPLTGVSASLTAAPAPAPAVWGRPDARTSDRRVGDHKEAPSPLSRRYYRLPNMGYRQRSH